MNSNDPEIFYYNKSRNRDSQDAQDAILSRYLAIVTNEEGRRIRKNQTYQRNDRFYK